MTTGTVVRRRLLLVAAGWLAVALPVWGQDAAAGTQPLTYETVSIKPNKPDGSGMMRTRMGSMPDRYLANGVSVKLLIQMAYNLKIQDQISGVPRAIDAARFDIEAKMDEATLAALKKLPMDVQAEQRRLMMQALLADRFKLKVHHESRELPVFSLTVAKGGSKLKEADPNNTFANGIKGPDDAGKGGVMMKEPDPNNMQANGIKVPDDAGTSGVMMRQADPNNRYASGMKGPPDGVGKNGIMMMRPGGITALGVPISNLANQLAQQLHRTVVDKTGLTGKYDISLTWTPDENGGAPMKPEGDGATTADSGPSIFTAVQEQLGLKLEAGKGPVDTIVVDHLEMPSEN